MKMGAQLLLAVTFATMGAGCGEAQQVPPAAQRPVVVAHAEPAPPRLTAEEERFHHDVARSAWSYMEANYQPATGLVNATPDWTYTTPWDIGAQILAFHSARQLGLLDEAEYERRTQRLLETMQRADLVRGATFSRVYSTVNGSAGDGDRPGAHAWSATDLGRLLIALRVLWTHEPQWREQIERIVQRNDWSQIANDGYVHGEMLGSRGQPWRTQEGRIGYEQYAAAGFDLWGVPVAAALDPHRHGEPREVLGATVLADRRGLDRLLSEPFVLMGIELGWTPAMRELAENVLAAQEARYRQTGQVTIVSEDAIGVAPYYFYYYCVLCNGREFVVDIAMPGNERDEPRWVSTKATFGWHALLPSEYTQTALDYIQPAYDARRGWASGVFEGSRRSTATYNINTAAVLLEVAHFQLRGARPLIEPAGS